MTYASADEGMLFHCRINFDIVRTYVHVKNPAMSVSLTELRQRLFQLADRVVDTGEPLIVTRRGVRLRLVREDAPATSLGRLARLKPQTLVLGAPLEPNESPAVWSEYPLPEAPRLRLRVAEPRGAEYGYKSGRDEE
jgi:antitoxin (DNA-binding transcriptional repressor) of toxin-antitoxin stability system